MVLPPAPAADATEEELDRRFNVARDELDRLMREDVNKAQKNKLLGTTAWEEKLVWMAGDAETCEQLNEWIRKGTLERNIRMDVARDANPSPMSEIALRLKEAADKGVSWALNKR